MKEALLLFAAEAGGVLESIANKRHGTRVRYVFLCFVRLRCLNTNVRMSIFERVFLFGAAAVLCCRGVSPRDRPCGTRRLVCPCVRVFVCSRRPSTREFVCVCFCDRDL